MLRPVRGVLAPEGIQTGDGRIFTPGSLEWGDMPLPFAWLTDGDQHADLIEVAPTIGTIAEISRFGSDILWAGSIDDAIPAGREFVRRMEDGSASLGSRWGLSIDGDNWDLEIVLTDSSDFEVVVLASGAGAPPSRSSFAAFVRQNVGMAAEMVAAGVIDIESSTLRGPLRWDVRAGGEMDRSVIAAAMTAAAGDGDPGGAVLFRDRVDDIVLRFRRLRIRGAVGLAVGAFAEAYCELAPARVVVASGTKTGTTSGTVDFVDEPGGDLVAAGAPALLRGLVGPDRPAAELFDEITTEPDGSLNVDDEHVHGYIATFDVCHTGYTDRCVLAPREPDYAAFMAGAVETEDGERRPVGVFTWGIPHADLTASLLAAQAHYADARHGFAHVAVGANQWGIWHSGALRPGTTRDDVRDLQALSMSGDWRARRDGLRMIAALAVNYPGFPVPRRAMAAGAGMVTAGPAAHFDEHGNVVALVAAGMVAPAEPAGHEGCGCDGELLRAQLDDLSPLVLSALDAQVGSWRRAGPTVHLPQLSRAGRSPVLTGGGPDARR